MRFHWPRRKESEPRLSSTAGRLVYAVGDIHGRRDALVALLDQIHPDARGWRGADKPVIVFLGDYVDRGADSRGVIDVILDLRRRAEFELVLLRGNHEQALSGFLRQPEPPQPWLQLGGAETLLSYGVDPPASDDPPACFRARERLTAEMPPAHHAFLEKLALLEVIGDYVFVHAGIRPGVTLNAQTEDDLLWIRDAFLQHRGAFEKVVVHGHTPVLQPELLPNRIGVDTGAYATGVLTAVRLENTERSLLQVRVY